MDEAAKRFPPGVEYKSIYDTTVFVRDSIKSVITTLLEATLLVVLAVLVIVIVTFDWNRIKPTLNEKVSEALHRPFPSSERQVAVFHPVVGPTTHLLLLGIAKLVHGGTVAAQTIGGDRLR